MMSCEIASAAAGHPGGGARLHHIMQTLPTLCLPRANQARQIWAVGSGVTLLLLDFITFFFNTCSFLVNLF